MASNDKSIQPLRKELSPPEEQAGAYVARYVKRGVKLMALTTTEIEIISTANTKITVYLSWAFFWFGVLASGLMLPDALPLQLISLFKPPYLFGFIGALGIVGAIIEWLEKQSIRDQINSETSTSTSEP